MKDNGLGGRRLLVVIAAAVLGAAVAAGLAFAALSFSHPRYRAETEVALLPPRDVPVEQLSNYWEALSRGQAARIGASVLSQRRWLAPAAQAAGGDPGSLVLTAGPVGETTLISVSLQAATPGAAELGLKTVIREAQPVVEQVSGPFALEVVQPADGSATAVGAARSQVIAVSGAAGLLIGAGGALMIVRYRAQRAQGEVPIADDLVEDDFPIAGAGHPFTWEERDDLPVRVGSLGRTAHAMPPAASEAGAHTHGTDDKISGNANARRVPDGTVATTNGRTPGPTRPDRPTPSPRRR